MIRLSLAGLAGLASLPLHAQIYDSAAVRTQDPVVVTATRSLDGNLTTTLRDAVVITREDLEGMGALTLAEVLQRRAGVEIRATGGPGQPTGIFMRGAGAAQTLVLVDGLRVGSATAGTTAIEAIPLEMIERIEIVKGALSSLYGSEAIGGVVQVFTRGKIVPHLFAEASYGSENDARASFGMATSDKDTRAAISAGVRKVDAQSATNPRVPFGVHDPDRDPHENAFLNLRTSQRMWQGETVTLEAFGSNSRTYFDGGSPDDRSEQKVMGARLTSSATLSPKVKSHLAIGHGRDELEFKGPFPSRFETRQDQASWITDVTTATGNAVSGLEVVRQRVYPDRDDAGNPIYTQNRRDTTSIFGSVNETWQGARLEASMRRDDDDQYGGRNTGTISAGYPITRGGTRVALTYARGFRAPTFNDLYLTFPGYTPNPELRPEKSEGFELALRGSWPPVTTWRLTAFDNRLEDLIVFSPSAGTVLNVNRARVRGIEGSFEASIYKVALRGSFTVQRPRDDATGARLQNRANEYGSLEASRTWGAWTAGFSVVASGDRYDSINEAPASRLAGYARIDARLRYDVNKHVKLELAAVNVADKQYETSLGYNSTRRGVMLNARFDAF